MNLAELRSETQRYTQNRPDITASIVDARVNQAMIHLAIGRFVDFYRRDRVLRFPELEERAEATVVSGQEAYTPPSTWHSLNVLSYEYDQTNAKFRRLRYKSPASYETYPETSGTPFIYTFFENTVYIRNIPDTAAAGAKLRMWGYKLPTVLTADGDSPVYSVAYHPLISLLAAAKIAQAFGLGEEKIESLRSQFAYELATRQAPWAESSDFNQLSPAR